MAKLSKGEEFGRRVQLELDRRKWLVDQLAEAVDVDKDEVAKVLKGRRVDADLIRVITKILGVQYPTISMQEVHNLVRDYTQVVDEITTLELAYSVLRNKRIELLEKLKSDEVARYGELFVASNNTAVRINNCQVTMEPIEVIANGSSVM